MIGLKGISFIISYQCNLNCVHCFFSHKHTKGGVINPSTVKDCLDDIEDSFHLEWLHVTGGEPFLFQNSLIEIIKIGKGHGISNIGTVTNAFWATSRDIAIKILGKFKDAGLTGLCVSADSFHQADIPLERVKNALYAMKYFNLNGHSFVVSCFIGPGKTDLPEDKKTIAILEELKDFGLPLAEVFVRPLGKGMSIYGHGNNGSIEGPCDELCVYLGDIGPQEPGMVYVDPYGLVQICYGLTIGNIKKKSFKDILMGYNSSQDIITDTIARIGPVGLLPLAEEMGYKRKNGYKNKCHLCYDARKFLVPYYPDALSPQECYP